MTDLFRYGQLLSGSKGEIRFRPPIIAVESYDEILTRVWLPVPYDSVRARRRLFR